MVTAEDPARLGREFRRRYTTADLGVLTGDELSRFAPGGDGDPQADQLHQVRDVGRHRQVMGDDEDDSERPGDRRRREQERDRRRERQSEDRQ